MASSSSFESALLTPSWQRERTILVRFNEAIRLCRWHGYREVPSRRAVEMVENLGRQGLADARAFVARARLSPFLLPNLDDQALRALLHSGLRSGTLAALTEGEDVGGGTDSGTKHRRLVREIEAKSQRRLSYEGRAYRLVAGSTLEGLPNRDNYEVVRQRDAVAILNKMASQIGERSKELARLLTDAAGMLAGDWRPPLRPEGLVLLRRVIVIHESKPDLGPALTPSQLRDSAKTDWIEVELVDENSEPCAVPYRLELPSDGTRQGNFDDQGFLGVYKIESGICKLALGRSKRSAEGDRAAATEQQAGSCQAPTPADGLPCEQLPAQQATQHFEARLVDELDQGIPGVEVRFSRGDETASATSDGEGIASADLAGSGDAQLTIPDATVLSSVLKSRWDQVRGGERKTWIQADDSTTVVPYRAAKIAPIATKPGQKLRISYQPYLFVARLWGALFDSNKCFLLPTVLPHIKHINDIYEQTGDTALLAVGHTDATADPDYNDPLSLERAEAMLAYLRDRVDDWYAWYSPSKPEKKRWGKGEDILMIKSLPEFKNKPKGQDPIRFYQEARGFGQTGSLTQEQRKALIKEYMDHDGTTLPPGVETLAHGCGESFPVSQPAPDESSADRHSLSEDRRVELFFFDKAMGIQPLPSNTTSQPGSPEYPEWIARQTELHDLTVEQRERQLDLLEFHDALFRTDSAVVLPEGEDPENAGSHPSLTTVGLVAAVLRYSEEHAGKRMLVAGHCDTMASADYNQTLSEERARVALACIVGDDMREEFGQLCHGRNDGVDKTQVIDWVGRRFEWDCRPTRTDQAPSWTTINKFQKAYNLHKAEIKAANHPDLDEDGDFGKNTWQAVFDCYEFALEEELGEDPQKLRDKIVWLDDARRSLGFSEHFPVDNLGKDQYRSQSNRRAEVLFFDADEEPDLATAQDNPEVAEFYLPGVYTREHLSPMPSALPWKAHWDDGKVVAKMDESREMILDAAGLPADQPVVWCVYQQVDDGEKVLVFTCTKVSQANQATAQFEQWYTPQAVKPGNGALPKVSFWFTVECGGRHIESNQLPYEDKLHLELVWSSSSEPGDGVDFTVFGPWGKVQGTTDSNGQADVEGLPPGGVQVVAPDHYVWYEESRT